MDMTGMTEYQKWEHAQIEDISHDTDALIKMLGSEKVGESYDSGLLAGMLSKQGIDPGILALLNKEGKDGWGDSGMLIVLFLILILGFGNGGFGLNRNGAVGPALATENTVVNEANYTRLLDAIGTQGTRQEMAVSQLAQALNCDMNTVQSALAGLDKSIAVNQGSVINAIQSCCCNLQSKIAECCCQTNLNVERTGNAIQAQIAAQTNGMNLSFAAQNQMVQQQFCAQNAYLAEQFCQIKNREDQREIQSLRDKLAEQRDNANTLLILNAIANKDTIAYTGTITGSTVAGSGTLS